MKKTYIKPETVSVKVNMENLMGNPYSFDGKGSGSITPQNSNAVGAAMGRGRNSDWGDED